MQIPSPGWTKIDDVISKSGLAIILYGKTHTGKTASYGNLPREELLVVLSEEKGLVTLRDHCGWDRAQIVIPKTSAEYPKAVIRAAKDPKIRYVVFDTITQYYALIEQEWMAKHNLTPEDLYTVTTDQQGRVKDAGKKKKWDRWDYALEIATSFMSKCMECVKLGMTIVFICHEKSTQEDAHLMDLPGQLPEKLGRQVDLIIRAYTVWNRREDKEQYYFEIPYGDSYGKDIWRKVKWPCGNDLMLVIDSCLSRPVVDTAEPTTPATQADAESAEPPVSALTSPDVQIAREVLLGIGKELGKSESWVKRLFEIHLGRTFDEATQEELDHMAEVLKAMTAKSSVSDETVAKVEASGKIPF